MNQVQVIEAAERSWPAPRPSLWPRLGAVAAIGGSLLAVAALLALVLLAALPLFGYPTTVVNGGSMAPALHMGSLIVSHTVDPEALQVGDVITFRRSEAKTRLTHRIVAMRQEEGRWYFTTKGDANATPDPEEIYFLDKAHKMVFSLPYAGYLLLFARSLHGLALLILVPALALVMIHILEMGKNEPRKEDR
jgi:signal peptidase